MTEFGGVVERRENAHSTLILHCDGLIIGILFIFQFLPAGTTFRVK